MNHLIEIRGGLLREKCSQKMSAFFKKRRLEQKQAKEEKKEE